MANADPVQFGIQLPPLNRPFQPVQLTIYCVSCATDAMDVVFACLVNGAKFLKCQFAVWMVDIVFV